MSKLAHLPTNKIKEIAHFRMNQIFLLQQKIEYYAVSQAILN